MKLTKKVLAELQKLKIGEALTEEQRDAIKALARAAAKSAKTPKAD